MSDQANPLPSQPATLRGALEAEIEHFRGLYEAAHKRQQDPSASDLAVTAEASKAAAFDYAANRLSALLEVGEEGRGEEEGLLVEFRKVVGYHAECAEAIAQARALIGTGRGLDEHDIHAITELLDEAPVDTEGLTRAEHWVREGEPAPEWTEEDRAEIRAEHPLPTETRAEEGRCPCCKCERENPRGSMDVPCDHPFHTPKRCPTCNSDDPAINRSGTAPCYVLPWDSVDPEFRCPDPFHTLPDRDEEGR